MACSRYRTGSSLLFTD